MVGSVKAHRRRPAREIEFDLEAVRDVLRLARRVVKRLTLIESWLKKTRDRQAANADQRAAAFEAYGDEERAERVREGKS